MIPNTPTEAVLSKADTQMSVQGISKAFDDQRVLADISFDVISGEILGLIGVQQIMEAHERVVQGKK